MSQVNTELGYSSTATISLNQAAVRTRPDGSLAVDYEKLSALAFAAIVELTARIEALEAA
jgi:hypothetical protein